MSGYRRGIDTSTPAEAAVTVPVGVDSPPLAAPLRGSSEYVVASDPAITVRLHSAGLACCAVEFVAAVTRGLLVPRSTPSGSATGADDDGVHVLIAAGTLTRMMAPALVSLWEALPQPRRALALGACASTGGPYWDSYSVVPGVAEVIPVHWYVPGCPPRPEALVDAVVALARQEVA